jgi:hypothetical protein
MKARVEFLSLLVAGALAIGCDSEPLGVAGGEGRPAATAAAASSGAAEKTAGAGKSAISGTISQLGLGTPDRQIITPSGHCRFWGFENYSVFQGDVSGPVTFHEQINGPCDLSTLSGQGPFDAQVTWNDRSGTIAGMWTTNCKADASRPSGLSCDGTMNARGSGGLEGVDFHFKWGPGWFPFDYSGTVFAH